MLIERAVKNQARGFIFRRVSCDQAATQLGRKFANGERVECSGTLLDSFGRHSRFKGVLVDAYRAAAVNAVR
jgi:hypothetical protein